MHKMPLGFEGQNWSESLLMCINTDGNKSDAFNDTRRCGEILAITFLKEVVFLLSHL